MRAFALASLACLVPLFIATRGDAQVASTAFYALTPCRAVSVQIGASTTPSSYAIQNVCGVPAGAVAVSANLTIVQPTQAGSLRAWAKGDTQPAEPLLSFFAGDPGIACGTLLKLATTAPDISVLYAASAAGTATLNIDVTGYFK